MTRAIIQRQGPGATAIDGGALLEPVRRKYEPHAPGVLYFVITVFLAIGAINSQNNLLFLAFGLAMAGLLISGLVSGPPLMRIVARRLAPGPAHVGETAEIRYAVASRGGFIAAMGLEIRELSAPEAPASFAPGAILHLPPGTDLTANAVVTPIRRGRHTLTGFSISSAFPFGLLRKTLIFEQPQAWVVAPRRVPLREMPWRKAGREGATLSATAARRGVSTEFYALRAYVPGDPTRQIAWRPSARVGELVVREQAASAPPKIWIRIDHPDDQTPAHLVERGAALVAALAQDATQAGFAVGLTGQGLNPLRPLSGSRQVRAIQVAMGMLGELGLRDDPTRDPPMNDRGTLRVRVQFRGSPGRASGGSEFRISAEEVRRWYAGETLPPEFEPAPAKGGPSRGGWLARARRLLPVVRPGDPETGGRP